MRRAGGNELAGEEHLEGHFAWQVSRERHGRCRAEKPDVDAGSGKARRGARHGEIALRRKLATRSGGDAVHAGNHRLRQARQRQHHVARALEDALRESRVGIAAQLLQIMASAKRAPRAGDYDQAHRWVAADGIECRLQFVDQRRRKRIELLRPV